MKAIGKKKHANGTTNTSAAQKLESGTRLGRDQIVGLLGAGGMGEVDRGAIPGSTVVAIKVLRREYARDRDRLR